MLDREGNDPEDSSQITYSELLKQVCKFANVLKAKGLSASTDVCLLLCELIQLKSVTGLVNVLNAVNSLVSK